MKLTRLMGCSALLSLVFAFAAAPAAAAGSGYSSDSTIYNPESNYFLEYNGSFSVSYTYTWYWYDFEEGGGNFGHGVSTRTLGLSDDEDFYSEIYDQTWDEAELDLFYNEGVGPYVVDVQVTGVEFTFGLNNSFQYASTAPTSSSTSVTYSTGGTWSPSYSGGGGGTLMYNISGYTNWGTSAWTLGLPGMYTFYVGTVCSPGHSGNATDPIQGPMQINYTAYTLTVNYGTSFAPTSSNTTISVNTPFTPSYSGGSGGTLMYNVSGYTNWGTASWTPTSPGTYTFYVGTKSAAGYQGGAWDPIQGEMAINYTAYTVTVTP